VQLLSRETGRSFDRRFVLGLTLVTFGLTLTRAEARMPNVVVFLSDDQGWGDLSISGNTNLETPHVDGLARDGARFSSFYVCPVCSPTRAEFLTGRYHQRGGVYSTSAGGERLDLDEKTIADTFKAAGYATGAFGKWHNGMQYPYHPCGRGFEAYYGFCSGHWGNYFDAPLEHNGQPVNGKGFIVDDLTDHAMAWMETQGDQPFFAYLPYNTPHSPMQVPERFYKKFADVDVKLRHRDPKKEDLLMTRAALAMCENIDWNVGRVLEKLDALKLADDTIVLYFSDNGPNSSRWNGDMKGRKGATDEGGVRSPLHVRWPGKIKPGTVIDAPAGAIDLLPTLADMAGISVISPKPLDGVSVKPLLLDAKATLPDRLIYSGWKTKFSVRDAAFRLDHRGALFDLQADPGQRVNVAARHPERMQRLQTALKTWKAEMLAELPPKDERTFPVGHRAFPTTQLPARDAVATGEIQRSNRFPNDSFFRHWTDAADTIRWEIDVATAGSYEAVLYYASREADVGAKIALEFRDQEIVQAVTTANDQLLKGAENDRVTRAESYVKAFKPLTLGTITLTEGAGTLVLKALEKPGEEVIEVRSIWLTLKD
jgi:arylsulfatase A-like enzyme